MRYARPGKGQGFVPGQRAATREKRSGVLICGVGDAGGAKTARLCRGGLKGSAQQLGDSATVVEIIEEANE